MDNNNSDVILLTVKLDEGQTESRIKAINSQLDFLRRAATGLTKDFKGGIISQQGYEEALGRITKQSDLLNKELTVQKKALADTRKGIIEGSGSLNELRAKADAARESYLTLSKAERENDQVGGALLKRVQDLNTEYTEHSKKLSESKKSVKDYILGLSPLGVNIGETVEAFKAGWQATKTFASGLLSTRGALIALTAVPIIAVLSGLYLILTKSQAGMDFLARKTSGLTAVLNQLIGIVIDTGKAIYDAFEKGELKVKILDAVVQNITNRFKGFGVVLDGILSKDPKKIADGVAQIGTGITNATDKANQFASSLNKTRQDVEKITQETQRIRDAEIKLNIERAKGQAKIEQLKKDSEDTTKSTDERAKAAQEAYNLENSLLQKSITLQKQKIKNINDTNKAQKQDGVEAAQALSDEEIKLADMQAQSLGRQNEIRNNLNSIRKEGADKALADQKKAADLEVAYWERALTMAKIKKEDTLAIEEQIIRLRAKADSIDNSSDDRKSTQERLLIQAKAEADILQLRVNYATEAMARINAIKQDEIKTLLTKVKEGTLAELELNKALIQAEADQQKDQAKATIQNKQELDARIKAIDAQTKKSLLDANKAYLVKQIELQKQQAERQQKISDTLMARFTSDQEKKVTKEQETADHLLAISNEESKAEHEAKLKQIKANADAAILAAQGNADKIKAIAAEMDKAIEEENSRWSKASVDLVVSLAQDALGTMSSLVEAQTQRLTNFLNEQQTFALKSAGANADLRAKIEEQYSEKLITLQKQQAEKQKKIASIENIIAGAKAATEAAGLFAKNPILGAITEALVLAKVAAQQAIIDSQQFADGGVPGYFSSYRSDRRGNYIASGPGTTRSDSIPARISLGESVINARSTALFYDQLSALNVAGGGRPFPGAGGSSIPALGGFQYGGLPNYASGGVASSNTPGIDPKEFAGLIEAGVASALANQKPPVLLVSDLHKVEADLTRLDTRTAIRAK